MTRSADRQQLVMLVQEAVDNGALLTRACRCLADKGLPVHRTEFTDVAAVENGIG